MKKRVEKVVKEKAAGNFEDEFSKTAGLNIQEKCPVQRIDDYQCSGSLEMDFPELCSLLGMKEIPAVTPRPPASVTPTTEKGNMEESQSQMGAGIATTTWCPKPRLQVELESEDPRSIKEVRVCGWKVDELMARVLNKTLPALSNLQNLHLWRAGLTGRTLTSLKNTISLCSNLRTVVLEGNPLPEQSYHLLISEDSMLTHVSLRNNRIGEEGARLIGSALATAHAANNNLLSLNLAFNSIGDAGAAYIAQGLRLNRSLLCLSLANNHIGDTGASRLAEVLGPFSLTHDEVVERRRLLLRRDQSPSHADSKCERPLSIPSSSSLERNVSKGAKVASKKKDTAKKDEKPAANQTGGVAGKKEEPKLARKASDTKLPRGKGGKSGGKEKRPSVLDQEEKANATQNKSAELVETVSPLLEPGVQHTGGRVILPGNTALTSLNLSGNMLSEQSLLLFLSSVGAQTEGGGLLRLCLNRNRFPPDCDSFLKIKELMSLRDPLNKTASAQVDDEQGQAA
ncbi:leucine-rich repeat-containing protein 71 [Salvelinus fontinalis]|uniref:leucine-rich repeat-containing protein 71 n=1 Tax=Salvelinus fontinalis TaxID=8038 RepID=UPI002485A88B|nr:leucine-rich repeat-containing protein 71 [Salvelinus fontinalis]